MSEFWPPTARRELSGLRARDPTWLSCLRVIRHSALLLEMSKTLTLWSTLSVTIKPTPCELGLLEAVSMLLHLKSLIAPSWPDKLMMYYFIFGDQIKTCESSDAELANKWPLGSHLMLSMKLWWPYQIYFGLDGISIDQRKISLLLAAANYLSFCHAMSIT